MKRSIPRDKLSGKARKALDRRSRVLWQRSPVTRCPAVSGAYDRGREKRDARRSVNEALYR